MQLSSSGLSCPEDRLGRLQRVGRGTEEGVRRHLWIYNDFFWAIVLISTGENMPITSALNNLSGQYFTDPNLIAAGALLTAIPTLIVYFALQRPASSAGDRHRFDVEQVDLATEGHHPIRGRDRSRSASGRMR
jgi:hypothetical protein